jgi:hypothetical protein
MYFSRRIALLLTLSIIAAAAALAQSSSSSSNPAAPDQAQAEQPAEQSHGKLNVPARIKAHRAQRRAAAAEAKSSRSNSITAAPAQAQAGQPATQSQGETQGQLSVQARIKARRAQRRAAAIHDAYSHRYEEYTGMAYMRFVPGPGSPAFPATSTSAAIPHGAQLQRAHDYAWNVGFTRYFDERLGVTVDGRGYYATAYTGIAWTTQTLPYPPVTTPNPYTNPAISQYAALAGPTYRFYVLPKFSVSGRVLGGIEHGNFSANTGHSTSISTALGLWPDGYVFAASASIPVEYNLTPNIGLRVAPEYYLTGFGSTVQYSRGFTTGIVYRFGKQ